MKLTKILAIKGTWKEIVDDCRFTNNTGDLGKEPSDKFKKEILIAEHSPIRNITFKWEWLNIPHWVIGHWVRHKWEKFVSTQRTDRTGVDRTKLPQDTPQNIRCEANIQHLIDTMRKRLCYKASPETRQLAEDLKQEITERDKFIGNVLVPNCIYRGGCPEMSCCGYYNQFLRYILNKYGEDALKIDTISNLQTRYNIYNEYFKDK